MECWYRDCSHSSAKNSCRFRAMPSNHCQAKIWMRYASIARIPKTRTAVLCTCHFVGTNENPIPYFEGERKQCQDNDLQVRIKSEGTYENEMQPASEEIANEVRQYKNEIPFIKDERALVKDSHIVTVKVQHNKKNKLEEVIKPRGFERELTLEKIVGVTNCKNELMFLLKWNDCLEYDLVKASEVNEKCPDIVIEYYESRCPINQKCDHNERFSSRYESELIENPAPIRDEPETVEPETTEQKSPAPIEADTATESVPETTEDLPFLESSEKAPPNADSDVVNAAFSINVDDTNSVQVSYSLPMIENLSGEELMETQMPNEQDPPGGDTSNCHMPDLQDVEMQ